jgi:hypothetical protein
MAFHVLLSSYLQFPLTETQTFNVSSDNDLKINMAGPGMSLSGKALAYHA